MMWLMASHYSLTVGSLPQGSQPTPTHSALTSRSPVITATEVWTRASGAAARWLTDFFSDFDSIDAIAIQSNGKIVAAGSATVGQVTQVDFALARYNSDGSLDAGFGSGGKVTTDFFNRS